MKMRVTKQIHGCFATASTLDRFVVRDIDLPFIPPIGAELQADDYWGALVLEVVINVDTGEVTLYVPPDREIYEAELHHRPARSIDEIVAEYVESGWTEE